MGVIRDNIRSTGESPFLSFIKPNDRKSASSRCICEEDAPDATSEKELGNEHLKRKNYSEAIICYSRSIALQPTAVAYANRAMAYLKIKRYEDSEADCTKALNLNDRYVKAYSRCATARKELRKLGESLEDSEFALKLEPDNQEIKKQHAEIKSLCKKEILDQMSVANSSGAKGRGGTGTRKDSYKEKNKAITKSDSPGEELENINMDIGEKRAEYQINDLRSDRNGLKNHRIRKKELEPSTQELASRAALRATVEAAKNITPPSSVYQFEISWRALSGDPASQARLLKTIKPNSLPEIFKNALTASIVVDIVKCIATFLTEEIDIAVAYLENLAKVARFNLIIMCLGSAERDDFRRLWDRVFCAKAVPVEYTDRIGKLQGVYCP